MFGIYFGKKFSQLDLGTKSNFKIVLKLNINIRLLQLRINRIFQNVKDNILRHTRFKGAFF